jgi:hypothetical protein
MSVFAEAGAALDSAYPERPTMLSHRLAGHPLLKLDTLAALAGRMRPGSVQCCRGDVPVDVGHGGAPETGRGVAETLADIGRSGAWVVFKYIEQDPAYRALIDALLGEIEPLVRPRTGPMLQREGFVFVSSPGAVTPFHFDPEHNILLQIAGSKVMTVLPPGDPGIVSGAAHERFHVSGTNGLEWREDFAGRGEAFALAPGEALYVPVKAPHWVKNGDSPSISLSITWRSGWSLREGDAHGCNRLLRRIGIEPRQPRRYPADNRLKAIAYRCWRRAEGIAGTTA